LASQRRESNVSTRAEPLRFPKKYGRSIRRFTWVYGGNGPPRVPKWIKNETGGVTKGKQKVPSWFTYEWWKAQKTPNRARSMRWWIQANDNKGQPIVKPKQTFPLDQAVDMLLAMNERAPSQCDNGIELMMVMNLDHKYPDQQLRCFCTLPHGKGGRAVRVAVFCPEDEEDEVRALGIELCGKQLADDIAEEKIQFDVLLAKPAMMPQLAKLGRILGPRRLMPSPKSGTVTTDIADAVKTFSTGAKFEIRTDTAGVVNCGVGKFSMGREKILDNIQSFFNQMIEKRPPGAEKKYWTQVHLGSSQSPSIPISLASMPACPGKVKAKVGR